MNINDLAFGLEFETTIPASDRTPIGRYHNGIQVAWLPDGWKAERDSSINAGPGRKACEFVSPKLRGLAGLREAQAVLEKIRERGGKVNPSCGLHITITWNGDAGALARLISLVGNHEKAIFASTGTRRREQTVYSKKIKQYGNKDRAKQQCESDRFHLLNLTHLARGRNRIEFRAFAGTLNGTKVAGYLMMCLGLVELAMNASRCSSWNYTKKEGAKSCWDRPGAGEGETELGRLYYRLGWTKGWYKGANRNKVFGQLEAGGETPDMKATKKKLTSLAKKYDAAV